MPYELPQSPLADLSQGGAGVGGGALSKLGQFGKRFSAGMSAANPNAISQGFDAARAQSVQQSHQGEEEDALISRFDALRQQQKIQGMQQQTGASTGATYGIK